MTSPQFKIGDTVIAVLQGTEQTPPLEIIDLQYRGDEIYYKLKEKSSTYWKDLMPGNATTWALAHLRAGFSIIPIEPGGKRPPTTGGVTSSGHELRFSWKRYQTERALESTVLSWAQRWPKMNHAVATGKLSGVIVLDIDTPEGAKYAKDHGLPQTPTATSGKGKHYYFKHPGETVKNFTRPVDGLDIKADGGYVVAPGSFHGERQTTYRWLVSPWECELADVPEWLLDLTKEPERPPASVSNNGNNAPYAEAAIEGELGRLMRTAQGQRNDQLNRSAFALGQLVAAGALDENEVRRSLSVAAQAIGLAEHESEATITSGLESGKGEPRQIPESKPSLPPLPDSNSAMDALVKLKEKKDAWISSLFTKTSDEPDWFELLKKIILQSRMNEQEIDTFIAEVEAPPILVKHKKTALKNEWRKARVGQQILNAVNVGERPPTWPYDVKAGRLVLLSEPRGYESDIITATPIADFNAKISHEITRESGDRIFIIDGHAIRGGPFSMEIAAEDFGSDQKLRAKLDAASGSLDPVRARMGNHLGPAIKLLTRQEECKKMKRYERTGWTNSGRFLIPGRPQAGTEIVLDNDLVYNVGGGDLKIGLEALDALLKSMQPERTTVAAAMAFQAPVARLAGWDNERYAVFISGRTGSLKTAFAQVLMCIYGEKFSEDKYIQKWGDGATANARMHIASAAHDLPLIIDNYKPSTGGGAKSFISLIHNIIEGAEKRRMNRSEGLRKSRPLQCWPICTGEDVPDGDPASLARILVITFAWQKGEQNPELTKAQELSPHLKAVGNAWIAWLETDEGRKIIERIAAEFPDRRAHWSSVLQSIRKDSVNVLRIASNLATNELSWKMLCEHPTIGSIARKYTKKHAWGLRENVAVLMAESTAEALEATRYIACLKELLATRKIVIHDTDPMALNFDERDRLIGWKDYKGVYLLPAIARRTAEQLVGDSFNGISALAMNKQLDALGLIADKRKGQYTKPKRIGEQVERVLHLVPNVFELTDDDNRSDAERIADDIPL